MVGDLIRLKLTLLRRSISGQRAAQMFLGVLTGLFAAGTTIWLTGVATPVDSVTGDLIATALAVWMFGWAFGPILFGSGGTELRPEQLALFPIRPRTLTAGLLGASAIGVGPAVTLIALTVLVVYGAGLGGLPMLVALAGLVLTLGLFVLLSKVIVTARAQVVRSQFGAALSGLLIGILMAAAGSVWAIVPAFNSAIDEGFSSGFSLVVHALPSGWALTAVDAASQSDWGLVAAGLAGLLVVNLLLAILLARLITRQVTSGRGSHTSAKQSRLVRSGPLETWTGRVSGVAAKELRTWFRDVTRTHFLYFALFYGLLLTVTPLLVDATAALPWTGITVAIWVAAVSANIYASDGTALWLTLVTPDGGRADVRGRQLAWLVIVAPIVAVLTVVFTGVSAESWAWPWALAVTGCLLGAGAGAVVLVAVLFPVTMTDPKDRGSGAWDNPIDFVQVLAVLVLMALAALPTFAVLWLGAAAGSSVLSWLAVPVGFGSGAFYTWWFGRLAYRRLESKGADLLQQLRTGHRMPPSAEHTEPGTAGQEAAETGGQTTRPGGAWPTVAVFTCFTLCWIPLFPQGIVPMVLKLIDSDTKSWFLALWLPEAMQWPTIVGMMVLGLATIVTGAFIAQRYDVRSQMQEMKEQQEQQEKQEQQERERAKAGR